MMHHHANSMTAYIKSLPNLPYSVIIESRNHERRLLFESGHIFEMFANEFNPIKKQYTKKFNSYFGCLGILNLNSPIQVHRYLILVKSVQLIDNIGNTSIYRIAEITTIPLNDEVQEHIRLADIRKFLCNGQFYLSRCCGGDETSYTEQTPNLNNMQTCMLFDITSSMQLTYKNSGGAGSTVKPDNKYFWNKVLFLPFVRYNIDMNYWLDKIICGFVDIKKIQLYDNFQSIICLISRVVCVLPGHKFPVRGLSDSIETAFAVETEQVIYVNRSFSSYVQLRGCTPLFWEQISEDTDVQRIQLTRGYELSHQTFIKYLGMLKDHYNGDIVLLNLLTEASKEAIEISGTKDAETFLSHELLRHYENLSSDMRKKVKYLQFDVIRDGDISEYPDNIPKINEFIKSNSNHLNVFLYHDGDIVTEQKCFIRCNCFDCLNRTNKIQLYIGLYFLNHQLKTVHREYTQNINLQATLSDKFRKLLQAMWIRNGSELSKFYVNLTSSEYAKDTDVKFDATDSSTFEAINLLLSSTTVDRIIVDRAINIVPPTLLSTCNEDVLRQICLRADEFSRTVKFEIGIGTFNANGLCNPQTLQREHMIQKWLVPLLPMSSRKSHVCDLYVIGFQDVVDINMSPLITTNLVDDNVKLWCIEIEDELQKIGIYSLVSYCQSMGLCLFIFIKEKYLTLIKYVSTDYVKTQCSGLIDSNNGAVAIRFAFCETTMCFICAHFTQGQEMAHERNKDYLQIMNSIHFPCAASVDSHDYIFFLGDLNYRIDLDNSKIRNLIRFKQYDQLLRHDQLLLNKKANIIFQGFQEGSINFAPTYKYDLNSNAYDTSGYPESPAWCDRILWKFNPPHKFFRASSSRTLDNASSLSGTYGYPGHCFIYTRNETKLSEHRPVFAKIEVGIKRFVPKLFDNMLDSIIKENGPSDSTISLKPAPNSHVKIAEPEFVFKVLEKLSNFGEVVMIRFCFNIMLATFAKPWFALNAVGVRSINVCGITLTICVRDPNWHLVGFKEVDFCHETNNRIKQSQQSILVSATSTTTATSRNVKQSKYQSVASMVSTASRKLLMSSLLPSKSSKTAGSTRFQRQRLPPPQRPNTNVIL